MKPKTKRKQRMRIRKRKMIAMRAIFHAKRALKLTQLYAIMTTKGFPYNVLAASTCAEYAMRTARESKGK